MSLARGKRKELYEEMKRASALRERENERLVNAVKQSAPVYGE